MIFNSLTFLLFFVVVFLIYWLPLKNTTRGQNIFLLLASYFFYGYADWKMLSLIIVMTLYTWASGLMIAKCTKKEAEGLRGGQNILFASKFWITLNIVLDLGVLALFKYYNFFVNEIGYIFGVSTESFLLRFAMPLGVSFFTFRLMSYVIEIYRGRYEPTKDIVAFGAYVAFFPCLLSGPIDRPTFIKQLQAKREFNYDQAVDGCRQILWGLFKKVVVADNCAIYVDQVWGDIPHQSGSTLVLAAVLYLFQIYADFSGYSDMAIGVGKLIGFKIADNFKFPLFALNIADYWRRWHITLTSWLTDYVFMPLNIKFRDWGNLGMILSIIITFVLIGMWHGANWTFALFGLYHGLLYIPLILSGAFFKKAKLKTNKLGLPVAKDFGRMVLTFVFVVIGLILFRADSVGKAWEYVCGICDGSLLSIPWLDSQIYYIPQFSFIIAMMVVEWLQRNKQHGLVLDGIKSKIVRYGIYALLIVLMLWVGGQAETFIYFQF